MIGRPERLTRAQSSRVSDGPLAMQMNALSVLLRFRSLLLNEPVSLAIYLGLTAAYSPLQDGDKGHRIAKGVTSKLRLRATGHQPCWGQYRYQLHYCCRLRAV